MMKVEQMTLIKQEEIAEDIFEIVLAGNLVKEMKQPGQFVNIKVAEGDTPLLRRPISICEINQDKQQFTMLYRTEGQGTKVLSQRKEGDKVDILGPLGTGFPVESAKTNSTAILVGGGIGVPPLYELSKQLVAKGVTVIHVLGFQTKSAVFYEEEFSKLGETYIATVDGTHGAKGFVTDIIAQEDIAFDVLYTCGPTPMLRALEEKYGHKEMYLSVEERMACGIGACFACVCRKKDDPTGYTYKKVCTDGPVFQAGEVIL